MPESRHRRKGRVRPRPSHVTPPPKNPPPSPPWVPVVGTGLLIAGLLTVLAAYVATPLQSWTASWPVLSSNWPLAFGFLLLIAGFAVLMRWR